MGDRSRGRAHGLAVRRQCLGTGSGSPGDHGVGPAAGVRLPGPGIVAGHAHGCRPDGDSLCGQQRQCRADPDRGRRPRRRPVRLGGRRRAPEQLRRPVGPLRRARLRRRRQLGRHRLPAQRLLVEPRQQRAARHRHPGAHGGAQGTGLRAVRARRSGRHHQLHHQAAAVQERQHRQRVGRQLRRHARDARFHRPAVRHAGLPAEPDARGQRQLPRHRVQQALPGRAGLHLESRPRYRRPLRNGGRAPERAAGPRRGGGQQPAGRDPGLALPRRAARRRLRGPQPGPPAHRRSPHRCGLVGQCRRGAAGDRPVWPLLGSARPAGRRAHAVAPLPPRRFPHQRPAGPAGAHGQAADRRRGTHAGDGRRRLPLHL